MTPEGLTIREEKAVQALLSCGNESEAYRSAYTVNPGTQEASVATLANRLFKKLHIRARIAQLVSETAVVAKYDLDTAMTEAHEAYALAKKMGNPAAMISAVTLKSKLSNILIEKREVTNRTAKEYSQEELDAAIEKAAKEAGVAIQKASA